LYLFSALLPHMFQGLQKKWKVGGVQLALILFTFAIGGSLTGYTARKIINSLTIETNWLWIVLYILLITILWPVAVIVISILFGQFGFFKKYLQRISKRIGISTAKEHPSLINIAIFASGAGTNANNIIQHFKNSEHIKVALVICNKPNAGVVRIAAQNNIPLLLIEKERFFNGDGYIHELHNYHINFIVLAGFLWKMPTLLIRSFSNKIINIHPALLPKYGGKGMYGVAVHQQVLLDKNTESGITIHYVDEHYDSGDIIFQDSCPVYENDTAETLAQRVHELEYEHYPRVIEKLVLENSLKSR
jgi:formyltetrahydrofolate-dependent phosphoribosylglycinamide formyltransferase